uniref:Cytochrome c-type biogenesis protein CcmE n=1 Tax=Manihot esculenta TaxID=3983 RepID=A0A2C9UHG1_MANES
MAFRSSLFRLRSHLLRTTTTTTTSTSRMFLSNSPILCTIKSERLLLSPHSDLREISMEFPSLTGLRFFSTNVDIGARARQRQAGRLWTYALTFSCIAGFIVIVLNNFQDQLVFYVTPTDAKEKYKVNPQKNKFRLGGLVLEGSVVQSISSPEMEFVITDLVTDILVRYQGSLPDLFREGHSVVVEGFVKPLTEELRKEVGARSVSGKARSGEYYFSATEVLAKHDEKYMPKEAAAAIEKNKQRIEAGERREEENLT